ncbi:hypothetical protein RSAG8_07639, partial [Rhizoctonia solani AG-8 WAC10335]
MEGLAQAIASFSLEFREYKELQNQRWADALTRLEKIETIAIEARDASLDHAQIPPSPETIKGKQKEVQQSSRPSSSLPTFGIPRTEQKVYPINLDSRPSSPVRQPRFSRVRSPSPVAVRAPTPTATSQLIKLKAPDVLKSTKTKDAKQWMMKVAVWASFSTNRFASEREMVKYLLTLMEGEAGDWALPHLAKLAGGDPRAEIYDMNSFGREFALAFDDPDAERAAARKITELTQTGNTAEYTTLFRTYGAELSWNDAALRAQYSRGLHFKVKEVLSQREIEPATLRDLINAANKIDQTRRENEESRPNRDKKDKDKGKG